MVQDPVFLTFINRILGTEGGYSFNPDDPGGETNWGISKRAYPNVDIKNLTRDGAIQIYYTDYWPRIRAAGSAVSDSIAFQVLDAAVNHGVGNAIRMLQRAVGVLDDGHLGPGTSAAIATMEQSDVIMRFNAERIEFYTRLSTFNSFGRGWANRVAANLRYGAKDN